MCKLENIARLCGGTTGGLGLEIKIACMDDICEMPSIGCRTTIDEDIALNVANNTIIVDKRSAVYSEKSVTNDSCGDYYTYELRFTKRKNSDNADSLLKFIKRLKNRAYLLSFIDKTGCRRIVFGAKASPEYSSGRLSADGNSYAFSFTGKSENPAYLFTGNIYNKNQI